MSHRNIERKPSAAEEKLNLRRETLRDLTPRADHGGQIRGGLDTAPTKFAVDLAVAYGGGRRLGC